MRWGTKKVRNFSANTIKIKQKRILGIICLKINNKKYTHKTKTNKQTRPRGAHVRSYFDERLAYI